jgi:hypothetical protein
MNWEQFISFLLQPLITGLLLYAIQSHFDNRAAKRLNEHRTRFNELHKKRAEVIAQLYKILVEIDSDLSSLIYRLTLDEYQTNKIDENLETVRQSIEKFQDYYQYNRIYLPEKLSERIDEFQTKSRWSYAISRATNISQILTSDDASDESDQEQYKQDLAKARELLAEVSAVKEEIVQEFRKLLGSQCR